MDPTTPIKHQRLAGHDSCTRIRYWSLAFERFLRTMQDTCDCEPLAIQAVHVSMEVRQRLKQCWTEMEYWQQQLLGAFEDLVALVGETLAFDFRSLHQRKAHASTPKQEADHDGVHYTVKLCGIAVTYTIDARQVQIIAVDCESVDNEVSKQHHA